MRQPDISSVSNIFLVVSGVFPFIFGVSSVDSEIFRLLTTLFQLSEQYSASFRRLFICQRDFSSIFEIFHPFLRYFINLKGFQSRQRPFEFSRALKRTEQSLKSLVASATTEYLLTFFSSR